MQVFYCIMQDMLKVKCCETNIKQRACYSFFSIFHKISEIIELLKRLCFFVAGADGKVDESMELMKEVEDLKQKKRMAEVGRGIAICFILGLQFK